MSVSLAAIADHCDLLAAQYREVSIVVIVDDCWHSVDSLLMVSLAGVAALVCGFLVDRASFHARSAGVIG